MRRQTNRFRPENPEPAEDSFFERDDAKFNVSQLFDNVSEKNCPTTSTVTSEQEKDACRLLPTRVCLLNRAGPTTSESKKVWTH